ncbi:hypothetical protein SERLA73DRAFT_151729 [Serpula lacrymans var. lacrymans S7.3]|uniref:Uncharacterized protein n=1 Tax=Serpula lacrymans var. lacrymans (strain S7.3) TaxID=936435 RepID=F8PS44_SERL3|nr:hypothetical protein SERLA73DRAFT_151729 [Serpula lacrymans var. lacrymans S7.3]
MVLERLHIEKESLAASASISGQLAREKDTGVIVSTYNLERDGSTYIKSIDQSMLVLLGACWAHAYILDTEGEVRNPEEGDITHTGSPHYSPNLAHNMSFPVCKACVIFVVGLAIGSSCTYFYMKRVFDHRIRLSLPVVDLTASQSSGFVQTGSDAHSVVGTSDQHQCSSDTRRSNTKSRCEGIGSGSGDCHPVGT